MCLHHPGFARGLNRSLLDCQVAHEQVYHSLPQLSTIWGSPLSLSLHIIHRNYLFNPNALPVSIAPKAKWNNPPPIKVNGECWPVSFFISSICTIGSDVALMIAINSLMSGLFSPYHIGTNIKS